MLLGRMDPKHGVGYCVERQLHKDNKLAGLPMGVSFPDLPGPRKRLVRSEVPRLLLVAQWWQAAESEGPIQT